LNAPARHRFDRGAACQAARALALKVPAIRWSLVLATVLIVSACSAPATPSSTSGRQIDVLTYLIGDASTWPRRGSHAQNQVVNLARQEVCWTKYANVRRFECWRWDNSFVYHAVDHALDGDSDESYRFTDGRWLPRFIPASATAAAPWTLDVAGNDVVWFDRVCNVVPSRSHIFPYRLRAWIESDVDGGGDLGLRETLLFEYEPYDPAAPLRVTPERFYFGRGVGWYRWQRVDVVDLFNRVGGPPTQMDRSVWCQG
jgi:hypothetical protein